MEGCVQFVGEDKLVDNVEVLFGTGPRELVFQNLRMEVHRRWVGGKANLASEGLRAALGVDGAAHHQADVEGVDLLARRIGDVDVQGNGFARGESVLKSQYERKKRMRGGANRSNTHVEVQLAFRECKRFALLFRDGQDFDSLGHDEVLSAADLSARAGSWRFQPDGDLIHWRAQ